MKLRYTAEQLTELRDELAAIMSGDRSVPVANLITTYDILGDILEAGTGKSRHLTVRSHETWADVAWATSDISDLYSLDEEQAAEWLDANAQHIQDRSVEHGWNVIEARMPAGTGT